MERSREHWSSNFGFIMAAAGSAIGLGTLWKFPYVVGMNGGSAFILVYILCTVLIGIPIFIAELLLGRAAQKSAVATFTTLDNPHSEWRFGGWFGVIASFLIMSYYSVLAGWGLSYVFMSLNEFWKGKTPAEIQATFKLLQQSSDITLFWHLLFTAITVSVVFRGVKDGIERWSKLMTSSLLGLLLLLVIYNSQLDGFAKAVHFIFTPDWSKLQPYSFLEALGLSFFTLSLGQGIMITYGSYMKKRDNIPKTSFVIASMVILVALLCALAIFPIVFTFGGTVESGSGLVFETLPLLFSQLPGAQILSTLFFILFVFTALTSAIALVEVVVSALMDITPWPRKRLALCVGSASFLLGIPSALSWSNSLFSNWSLLFGKNFFETVDSLVSVWLLPLAGLLVALFCSWKLHKEFIAQEFTEEPKVQQGGVEKRSSWQLFFPIWYTLLRWLAPVAILAIILRQSGLVQF